MSENGMKFVGKDPNGTARAIKVNTNGKILVSGDSEIVVFSKENMLAPRLQTADYEPRTAGYLRVFYLPHLWTPYASEGFQRNAYRNIFDQTIIVYSSLDVALTVQLGPTDDSNGAVGNPLYAMTIGEIPAASATNRPQRMIMIPQKSYYPVSGYNTVYEVAELRQPIPGFRMSIFATDSNAVPTQGEIKIMCIRRY